MRAQQGNQNQAAMEFRFFSPIHGQGKGGGEVDHVPQGNDEKGSGAGLVKLEGVETSHGDGGGNAQHGDYSAEAHAEPPDAAVPAHVVAADQRGLEHEQDQPAGENGRMHIKNEGAGHGGMDEVLVHGVAEAVHHGPEDQQRHEEIEVVFQQGGAARRGGSARW